MGIGEARITEFLESLGKKQPTPGGGAAAGMTGAIATALGEMVVSYSLGKKSLAAHSERLEEARQVLGEARRAFMRLADEDAEAYGRLNAAMRMEAGDPRRAGAVARATEEAMGPPMRTAGLMVRVLECLEGLIGRSNERLASDLAIAAVLGEACVRSAAWNVRVNAREMAGGGTRFVAEVDGQVERAVEIARRVEAWSESVGGVG